ncbi:hypothetical protein N3K66_006243 [Trichothecium roseum]|uniref:Uncharacterized protein n=1 Tax=Trichothecium roseum TaxID=47278 RepID=A0ACC0V043_9HYPO|nr:hypothetical protein N3K66_006243 [Trichothecium roseum]
METDKLRSGLGRRRACDFCCRKKIKCDAKKPTCSGCSVHGVDCVWTPNPTPKRSRAVTKIQSRSAPGNKRFESIEDRLARIEARLDQSRQRVEDSSGDNADHEPSARPSARLALEERGPRVNAGFSEHSEGGARPSIADMCPLPDEHVVEGLLQGPFKMFNDALPIFELEKLMETVRRWYRDPSGQDTATWAAINVAMALGLRHAPPPQSESSQDMALACISNAQSCIDGLVYRDRDLKGLQVLLGLVVLFLASPHPYPACVWIATAVKLAHRLRLHRRDACAGLDADAAPQRRRLFWVTYVLDRELCNHTLEPYLIRDDDFDVEEPATLLPDRAEVNLFHLRCRLARVHGKAYDAVHSVRASGLSARDQGAASFRVGRMLRKWYASVPAPCRLFGPGAAPGAYGARGDDGVLHHVVSLHLAYYRCLFSARGAYAGNARVVESLMKLGDDPRGEGARVPLPLDWADLEQSARECLQLLKLVKRGDPRLKWSAVCASQGAIVVLAAKNIAVYHRLDHETLTDDGVLVLSAVEELKRRLDESEDPVLRRVHAICHGLGERCADAVEMFYQDHPEMGPGAYWR